jgi:hypothetical protein
MCSFLWELLMQRYCAAAHENGGSRAAWLLIWGASVEDIRSEAVFPWPSAPNPWPLF